MTRVPTTELDSRYSSPEASATSWDDGRKALSAAELYWITTVRPDGRPHVTPLIAVFVDDTLYFTTGPDEQKAKNLNQNPHVGFITGCNTYGTGLDVVVEGEAERITDDTVLQHIADEYVSKYGDEWRFEVRDGMFHHEGGDALVFAVAPVKAFGFGKGNFSQTRWRWP